MYMAMISERHPLLTDCWAMMDGLKLYLQASGNSDIQERYYNGWTHDHYVTSIICFYPDETIPMTVRLRRWVRFIGSWRRYMKEQVGNVVSTQLLLTSTDSTFTSLVKTYWDHWLLPKLRGRSNYEKKERRHQQSKWLSGGC